MYNWTSKNVFSLASKLRCFHHRKLFVHVSIRLYLIQHLLADADGYGGLGENCVDAHGDVDCVDCYVAWQTDDYCGFDDLDHGDVRDRVVGETHDFHDQAVDDVRFVGDAQVG